MEQTTAIDIKTLDITAKEWFDKANGNSYFSARVIINYGEEDATTIYIPFQYGYGSHYEYICFKALQDKDLIPKQNSMLAPWRYYQDHNIIARTAKIENCLKRDVVAYGAE